MKRYLVFVIWGNSAPNDLQIYSSSTPSYSCIDNWADGGVGNITDDSLFVHPEVGDFHLQAASPCIDAGGMASGFWEDFKGDTRPFNYPGKMGGDDSNYDIGADGRYILSKIKDWELY